MIFDAEEDEFILSSGRRFYAFSGEGGGLSISSGQLCFGHDGTAYPKSDSGDRVEDFTESERHEIADSMIAIWLEWRNKPVFETGNQTAMEPASSVPSEAQDKPTD